MTAVAGSLRLLQRYGLTRNGTGPFLKLPVKWHAAKQQSVRQSLIPGPVKHAIAICTFLCLLPLAVVGQSVTVNDNFFSSNAITITAGQTVTWTWSGSNSGSHDVVSGSSCSSDGQYSSPFHSNSGTFTHQYTAVGTYNYFCSPHCGLGMTGSVAVSPAAATHLVMSSVPGSATAGVAFNVVVTAYDQFGNIDTNFGNTVSFTSSDGQAILPSGTLFSGQRTFSITLKTANSQSLTANASGVSSSGPFFINVSPAAASHFSLSPSANPVNAGSAFNATVTALDPYGNIVTGYGGTVHFTSSDGSATLPAANTLVSGSRTFTGFILRTAPSQTITATDNSINGTATITVDPGPASQLSVTAPPSASVGLAFNITVTALDQFGNQATTSGTAYTGTVHFTSSDGGATLPADYTFVTGDNGVHIFSVTLSTIGTQSVTATDNGNGSIHGSANVTVKPPCPAATKTFSNNATINFSTTGSGGTATTSPYPSVITVSGMTGTIAKLTVTLNGLTVPKCAPDLAFLLQGPHGQFIVPMTDVGPCNSTSVNNVTLTLDDAAASPLPAFPNTVSTGTYKPSSYDLSHFGVQPSLSPPAPVSPYTATQLAATDGTATFASVFNGTDPNGTWNLYVLYQTQISGAPADSGSLTGWSLTITPQFAFANTNPITFTTGTPNPPTTTNPYPSAINVSGLSGNITKLTLTLKGLTDKCPADLALLLQGPQGQVMVPWSLVGGCTLTTTTVGDLTLDDAAASLLPKYSGNSTALPAGTYQPSSYLLTSTFARQPSFVPGAPAGPYPLSATDGSATFASIFNGTNPNGTWNLYLQQQFGGSNFDAGQFAGGWSLTFQTDCPAGTNCTVNSNANPSVFGQPVGLTATVSSGSGTPFSPPQVTYLDGVSNLATINLNGSGQATVTDAAFTIGTHPITVNYPGNTTFASCTSAIVNQVVNQAGTTAVVTTSGTPSVFGQGVTFTATITANAPGAGTPTGTVTFMDGVSTLGTGTLGSGTATFTTSALAIGGHSITAVYGGDADFNGSTSPALTQNVNKDATTGIVGSSVDPSVFGNSVTFTATVTAAPPGSGTPTGTATFFDGVTSLGPGTLDINGKATLSTAALAVGSHSITTTYNGDGNFTGSTSPAITQTVNQGTTTTSVGTSGTPSVFGNSVTFTAAVAVATGAGIPTGTVTFFDGATPLGSGAVNGSGHATLSTASLGAGSHAITATYNGDTNFSGSTSGTLAQIVNQGTTTTIIGTSGTPSTYGSSVTFTATVADVSGSGIPTGTVTFMDGVATLGSGTLNGGGVATFSITTLAVAVSHSISAVYNGDANLTGSTSSSIGQVVNQAATTVNLISSQNPSLLGHPVTFTATVNPQFSGVPTGNVTFFDGTTRNILGTVTLNGSGVATVTTSSLDQESHDITATYNADSNFTGSASAILTQVVNALPVPAITLTSHPNPAGFRQQVILTATVSTTGETPTGTVAFKDGANTIGTANLTTVNPATAVATITTNQWTIGSHQLTAVYSGDFNFGTGTSPMLVQLRTPKPH